ncbi:hypothetical protein HGM15179_015678 [Zosterops borbonicus]|uniref:Reverse transcriptase thumb domain-containing protein n=1 Tax=Zosterops borbonicus TaxID=364589 RepID=A0A8K1G494_9PASS|nr:hypothetical protein HGM15179_015678 [Zosterops borbonicus]
MVKPWQMLPMAVVEPLPLEAFKTHVDVAPTDTGAKDSSLSPEPEDNFPDKTWDPPLRDPPLDGSNSHQLFPPPESFLTTTSQYVPFHLKLVKPLWIRDTDWHTATVANNRGAWHLIGTEWAIVGDSTHQAIIHHYVDDVLVRAPNDDLLAHALDLTVTALVAAGFELQESKIQKMPPWKYLGLEIGKRTIVPQKLAIKTKIETLADVHHLRGALNSVRPWLGLSTEDLAPLFNLLKGGEGLSSPRSLTPEAQKALERVQHLMSTWQANRCNPDLPFRFIILGNLPHLHGVILQWDKEVTIIPRKDRGGRDPLLIIEWVFLSHHRSKRMTKLQELMADLIRKARVWIRELACCDFECIHMPIRLKSGQITKVMLEHLLQENEALQFALDSYSGQISIHRPAHKIFNQDAQFQLALESVQSKKPLKALTIFTDASRGSHKSVMIWKDPQTQQWESDIAEVEGSPQVAGSRSFLQ